ncbi:hypothetical protein DBR42_12805 [Pelomonas sp. HMWF004]|nr:hypothetical protein DBR42_12805 [Pelomonas sp. HMWF004]
MSAWNPDAGYGRIRPAGGGDEVFVGLAAFPTDGDGPQLDEPLSFEIVTGRDGRKQAAQLKRLPRAHFKGSQRPAAPAAASSVRLRQARVAQRKRRLALIAGTVAVTGLLVLGGVRWWQPAQKADDVPTAMRR